MEKIVKDDRLFAPFPIEMDEHPKIIGLSDAAFRAVFEATFYSRRMMSDGFLDERIVLRKWGQPVADELSSNDPERPSWIRVEHGWRIHDFEKHHPVRAEIQAKRDAVSARRSAAGKKGAQARWDGKPMANEWQTDGNGDGNPIASDSSETESETESQTTPKGVAPRKRGTRLTDDFVVTADMVDWAKTNAPLVDGKRSTEKFVNHFMAKSGRDATKVDWIRTWRNWLLSDQERAEKSPATKKPKVEQIIDVLEQGRRMQEEDDRKALSA